MVRQIKQALPSPPPRALLPVPPRTVAREGPPPRLSVATQTAGAMADGGASAQTEFLVVRPRAVTLGPGAPGVHGLPIVGELAVVQPPVSSSLATPPVSLSANCGAATRSGATREPRDAPVGAPGECASTAAGDSRPASDCRDHAKPPLTPQRPATSGHIGNRDVVSGDPRDRDVPNVWSVSHSRRLSAGSHRTPPQATAGREESGGLLMGKNKHRSSDSPAAMGATHQQLCGGRQQSRSPPRDGDVFCLVGECSAMTKKGDGPAPFLAPASRTDAADRSLFVTPRRPATAQAVSSAGSSDKAARRALKPETCISL